MKTLAMSALTFFKENCFQKLIEPLRNALISQISKDRDGEYVDWALLKKCIQIYVHMGFNNADIAKEEEDYVWRGDKNLAIYESEFEKHLLTKV